MRLHLKLLPPGTGAPEFDSDAAGASLPISVDDLAAGLLPGESMRVSRDGLPDPLIERRGAESTGDPPRWISALVRRLPVEGFDAAPESQASLVNASGRYELLLRGDLRGVNAQLAAVASRMLAPLGAILAAILLTWLALELSLMRRITLLTRRAAAVSRDMRSGQGLALELDSLRGRDELGVLAQGLADLLGRVNDDVRREQIRVRQERDQWHAVGHEIVSPLQSLLALHADPDDPSQRYLRRMQQAVRVLYGQASPSEAFESTALTLGEIDLDAFLAQVTANAGWIGIADVEYASPGRALAVRADEHPLEDAVSHLLNNADRFREPGSAIRIALDADGKLARFTVFNRGPAIPGELIDRIFDYGVSGVAPVDAGVPAAGDPHRGQGLFVARTYLAKMGGTIAARNLGGGVEFTITLPLAGT